jgi:sugar phosphate isomerase/epimerase
MKQVLILLLIISINGSLSCFSQGKELDNIFYCFNNAVRMLPNAPVGFEEQAKLVKRLAYAGISGSGEESYFEFRKALDKVGLAIPETYISLKIDSGVPNYNPLLKDLIRDSKDRDLLITLHLHSGMYMNNKDEGDIKFAAVLTELADYALQYNVKLAVYPHIGFYCEKFEHSVKLAKMVNRPNVGAVFNLCHYLKTEEKEKMAKQIKKAVSYIFMVSICGADDGDTKNMDWDRLIQPLGTGSFDTYSLVKLLKDNGYNGKFGLQCYNIKLDCEVALTQSMNTWNEYRKKYALTSGSHRK